MRRSTTRGWRRWRCSPVTPRVPSKPSPPFGSRRWHPSGQSCRTDRSELGIKNEELGIENWKLGTRHSPAVNVITPRSERLRPGSGANRRKPWLLVICLLAVVPAGLTLGAQQTGIISGVAAPAQSEIASGLAVL